VFGGVLVEQGRTRVYGMRNARSVGYLLCSSLAALLLRAFVCGFNLNRGFCLFLCCGSCLDPLCSRRLLLAQLWRIVGMEYSRWCYFLLGGFFVCVISFLILNTWIILIIPRLLYISMDVGCFCLP
jgi:hypothetical protein